MATVQTRTKALTWEGKPFSIESYTNGPVYVADTDMSRANKEVFERHLVAEWSSEIEETMATVHPDGSYQRIPALGVDVQSFAGIREFYLDRFEKWPGPALKSFTRVTIVDNCIYVEGEFDVEAVGDDLQSLNISGKSVKSPCMIALECRDGLLVGEIVYMDSGALKVS
ncbi:hypothetical protein P3T23_002848 [Paraburkholderia sp. GAS448]|uniref:hypothetical protein n=1 Tax=Paraburkholderia sp. GAS448 TaxID=3035136 RepID=UPI003D237F6B